MARQQTIGIPCDVVAIAAHTFRGKKHSVDVVKDRDPTLRSHRTGDDAYMWTSLPGAQWLEDREARVH